MVAAGGNGRQHRLLHRVLIASSSPRPISILHNLSASEECHSLGFVGDSWSYNPVLGDVESPLCFPLCFVLLLLFGCDLVLVDQGEGQRKIVVRVSVELCRVVRDLLTELLFLKFPDVQLLSSILKHVDSFRYVQALF